MAMPRMSSTSCISGTGLKKCMPITFSGRLVTAPIWVVFLALTWLEVPAVLRTLVELEPNSILPPVRGLSLALIVLVAALALVLFARPRPRKGKP